MNLVAFLEFLIEAQRALRESVKALSSTAPADAFADLKRLQDELQEEVAPLKEKIKAELRPQQQPGSGTPTQAESAELERGITLLEGWADAADKNMSSASRELGSRQTRPAATSQQSAIGELEKIWEAVIPFHSLLARDLADQAQITGALQPPAPPEPASASEKAPEKTAADRDKTAAASHEPSAGDSHLSLANETEELARLAESQERTQRRTQLLKLKAESELSRVNKPAPEEARKADKPANSGKDDSKNAPDAGPKPVDPEKIKAGFQKAIDLAPKAAGQMERAAKALKRADRQAAYPPAEEARKILEEIQKAQPPDEQQKQDNKDQEKKENDQQKQDQDKKKDDQQKQDKKDQNKEKKDQQKQDKKDQEKKQDQEKKKQDDRSKSGEDKQQQKQPQQQFSRDQIEEALRKVRERQQEKRERDRKMNARVIGRVPVEKDW